MLGSIGIFGTVGDSWFLVMIRVYLKDHPNHGSSDLLALLLNSKGSQLAFLKWSKYAMPGTKLGTIHHLE